LVLGDDGIADIYAAIDSAPACHSRPQT
jgi:hypothetical protein